MSHGRPPDYVHGRIEVLSDAMSDSYKTYSNKYHQIKNYQQKQLSTANVLLERENTLTDYANKLLDKQKYIGESKSKLKNQIEARSNDIQHEIEELTESLNSLIDKFTKTSENIASIESKNVELKNNVQSLEQQMSSLLEKEQNLVVQIHNLIYEHNSNSVEIEKVKLTEVKNNIQDLDEKTTKQNEKIKNVNNDLDVVVLKKNKVTAKQKELQMTINKLQEVRVKNADQIRSELQALNSKQYIEEIHRLENERSKLESNLTTKIQQEFGLSKELNNFEITKLKKSYRLTEQQHELDNLMIKKSEYINKTDFAQISNKHQDSNLNRLKKLNEQYEELQKQLKEVNIQITTETFKKDKANSDLKIANNNFDIANDIYNKIEEEIKKCEEIQNQIPKKYEIEPEIEIDVHLPEDVIEELNAINLENSKLLFEISNAENQIKQFENQHATLVRQIKQALKIPPDLIQTLKSTQTRFLNSKDIRTKVRQRMQARNTELEMLATTVNHLELDCLNKNRKINQNQVKFLNDQYNRLSMLLFNTCMTGILSNLTLEDFPSQIDYMNQIFSRIL